MWIVFTPFKSDDEPVPFAKFCYSPDEVQETVHGNGANISMVIPLNCPIETAKLLQMGFRASLEPPVSTDDRIKELSQSLRTGDFPDWVEAR